ncbi:hypothetical protein E2986_12473 [Frieseomelitta varia]|uniref:Uncharacterized protein n=1 Tax=Frieseomelitta varia TaxID=561572 RepID=A0A833RP40_9HYME|nr:hypothetical protein E2986_12473 [Frieseomelitta varia]
MKKYPDHQRMNRGLRTKAWSCPLSVENVDLQAGVRRVRTRHRSPQVLLNALSTIQQRRTSSVDTEGIEHTIHRFPLSNSRAAIKQRYQNVTITRSSSDLIEYSSILWSSSMSFCVIRRPG